MEGKKFLWERRVGDICPQNVVFDKKNMFFDDGKGKYLLHKIVLKNSLSN